MLVGIDVDGCIDADPAVMLALMQALRAAGQRVVILTGCSNTVVSQQDIEDKRNYLQQLGCGQAYDQLVVFADPAAPAKAEWLADNHADMLIDNSKTNAKMAPCFVLVPWQSRVD